MPITPIRLVLLALVVALPVTARAATNDKSTPAAPPASRASATAAAAQAPVVSEDRVGYDPAGRRDPFVSLLSRGDSRLPAGDRTAGTKGLLINELAVRGVLRSGGALLAIVQAPDKKSYTLRPGDSLLDGAVKVVAKDAVIFVQRVDDPLSPVKQREIRKTLRTPEENR